MNKNLIRIKMLNIEKELLLKFYKGQFTSPDEAKQLYLEYTKLQVMLDNFNPCSKINPKKYVNGNCYTFALDIRVPNLFTKIIQELLKNSNVTDKECHYPHSKEEIINSVLSDLKNLNINFFETTLENDNINNGYKIAILSTDEEIGHGVGFHVIRENSDKTWSEKYGYKPVFSTFNDIYESPYFEADYHLAKVYEIVKPNKPKTKL